MTKSILIVDDTLNNLRLLAGILSDRGYRVRPVTSGAPALATVEKEVPDLILLDLMMPGLNGYEVCQGFQRNQSQMQAVTNEQKSDSKQQRGDTSNRSHHEFSTD